MLDDVRGPLCCSELRCAQLSAAQRDYSGSSFITGGTGIQSWPAPLDSDLADWASISSVGTPPDRPAQGRDSISLRSRSMGIASALFPWYPCTVVARVNEL